MDNRNNRKAKFFKAMMLSALAMLMMNAHRASALPGLTQQALNTKSAIVYQITK